jgi:hypothetical protein
MRSAQYTPRSPIAIALLIEAVEFVRDFEGDMIVELAQSITCKVSQARRDETLADIVDMNRRVGFATRFVIAAKELKAKVGETIYFDATGIEVIDKGLDFLNDQVNEAVTEVFYDKKYANGATPAQLVEIREAVEKNLERADVCADLLKEFRAMSR